MGVQLEWARLENVGEMRLGELLQLMTTDPDAAAELYIHDESLCKRCPDVLADFIMPKVNFVGEYITTSPTTSNDSQLLLPFPKPAVCAS